MRISRSDPDHSGLQTGTVISLRNPELATAVQALGQNAGEDLRHVLNDQGRNRKIRSNPAAGVVRELWDRL